MASRTERRDAKKRDATALLPSFSYLITSRVSINRIATSHTASLRGHRLELPAVDSRSHSPPIEATRRRRGRRKDLESSSLLVRDRGQSLCRSIKSLRKEGVSLRDERETRSQSNKPDRRSSRSRRKERRRSGGREESVVVGLGEEAVGLPEFQRHGPLEQEGKQSQRGQGSKREKKDRDQRTPVTS